MPWATRPDELREQQCGQVQGSALGHEALVACEAVVVDVEQHPFRMRPLFIDTPTVLSGRRDFMSTFGLIVEESSAAFALVLPHG